MAGPGSTLSLSRGLHPRSRRARPKNLVVKKAPILELQRVTKTYDLGGTSVTALKPTSLAIRAGEYVSIQGPSGSGKSTLMYLMGLLDSPSSGQVLLDGQNVSSLSEKELARIRNQSIGFVFQQFNLLPKVAAWEQVALPLVYAGISSRKRRNRAIAALNTVGLADRIDHRPNQLSGGQQQRIAIARALVNNPSIIFADEPTGNLDTASGETVLTIFDRLHREGKTIVIVTHEANVARRAKRHIAIKDGKVEEGTRK